MVELDIVHFPSAIRLSPAVSDERVCFCGRLIVSFVESLGALSTNEVVETEISSDGQGQNQELFIGHDDIFLNILSSSN